MRRIKGTGHVTHRVCIVA